MATPYTDKWQEDKGLMAKSGPTHLRCCMPPQCPMASRSLFSKAPDPPDAEGPKRASVSGGGGVRDVRRSAKRVAPDFEGVVPGGEGRTPRLRSECLVTFRGRHRQVNVARP